MQVSRCACPLFSSVCHCIMDNGDIVNRRATGLPTVVAVCVLGKGDDSPGLGYRFVDDFRRMVCTKSEITQESNFCFTLVF
jgi:hypothetical protein